MAVNTEEFVKAWQESNSVREVGEKLKIENLQGIRNKAAMLRKRGVKLKQFQGYARIDVEALNKIIAGSK